MQEGWELPDEIGLTTVGADVAAPVVEDSWVPPVTAATTEPEPPFGRPVEEFLGTSDPFEAMMKIARLLFPFSVLMVFITIFRNMNRN